MPEKPFPIYQIQDFAEASRQGPGFYLNLFERHLQQHTFIQKPHKHDFYIILLVTQGSGTHTIDFKTYPVNAQTIFFLSPGQVHSWQLSEDTAGYILFFNSEFIRLISPQQKLLRFPFFNSLLGKPLLTLPPEQAAGISTLIDNMAKEYANRPRQWEEVIGSYLHILLIQLARIYEAQNGSNPPSMIAYPAWGHLEELMEQHYKQHEPVNFYADKLHTTARQLNEICKNTLNKTVLELLQDRVILEARRLLTHSALTITQVAAELGYFDNSYFARFFKKHTGQTPEQFRQSIS
jgi:AraC family transcriptional regulator, transcriptional activator of pobA